MSMGFALTLPDGVFFMADSQLNKPLVADSPKECVNKIVQISDFCYAIPFGVTFVTNNVIASLQQKKYDRIEDLAFDVENILKNTWGIFWSLLGPDVDKNNEALKSAIIIGGIINSESFIAASLIGNDVKIHSIITHDVFKTIMLGGEEINASNIFMQNFNKRLNGQTYQFRLGPNNVITNIVKETGYEIITSAMEVNATIGGPIQYLILRKCYSIYRNTIDN